MTQLFIPAILVAAATLSAGLFSSPLLAAPGAHGPNGEHLDAPANTNPGGLARLPDGSVNIPKLGQRRMEIRTQMVFQGEHTQTTELNGKVEIDPNAGGRVQAPFQGRVEPPAKGFPVLGQNVRKGEVLAYLSPVADAISVGSQRAELAEVKANLTLAQQRVERMKVLQGTIPKKELEAAQAQLSALQGRERALSNSVQGRQTLLAPANGVIAKSKALNGQVVEPSHVLFEVIDPSRLLIEANTANATLAQQVQGGSVANIDGVELTLLGAGRSLVNGAIPITFRANAAQGNNTVPLAVGQPVTVLARLNTKVKGIVLPSEAVVRNPNNEAIVWIKSGAERFIAQPVEYQALDARQVVITKGLADENRVVVSGTNLINQIR
ncbi:efflux RND transporter periplasmic adaptor subunit [Limnobacter sp.]|uniref:efflux RND transporter periplasmic adaptor subunit n=1 Tax=Limnobacter sp. TaxID=2003368 RepID=UPI0027340C9E|nr:efflux RND transporter periplasmic adaptor subunit [Limnobacter sp.]MDP3271356.1 efflux RND transporter periplasmic adaptor subunit [Limnobacter sp.]